MAEIKQKRVIVAIDGPAGAGKSTIAKRLADRLGFTYIDTGAMYRAVALAGMRSGVDWDRPEQLAELAEKLDIRMDGQRTMLGDEDVSEAVRSLEVTAVTRYAADNPRVRQRLVQLQRAIAGTDDIVTEGRDQGTVVFPDAACKIFLTASAEERARRRWNDLRARDETVSLEDILAAQRRRDHEDASRAVGPLLPAADAVKVVTDGLSEDAVVNLLESLARGKYGKIT